MMPSSSTAPKGPRDDGFRVSDATIDAAIAGVMAQPGKRPLRLRFMVLSTAAAVALVLGMGVALTDVLKTEPCMTFACQLETLSDEELAEMMNLMDEEASFGREEADWPTLY